MAQFWISPQGPGQPQDFSSLYTQGLQQYPGQGVLQPQVSTGSSAVIFSGQGAPQSQAFQGFYPNSPGQTQQPQQSQGFQGFTSGYSGQDQQLQGFQGFSAGNSAQNQPAQAQQMTSFGSWPQNYQQPQADPFAQFQSQSACGPCAVQQPSQQPAVQAQPQQFYFQPAQQTTYSPPQSAFTPAAQSQQFYSPGQQLPFSPQPYSQGYPSAPQYGSMYPATPQYAQQTGQSQFQGPYEYGPKPEGALNMVKRVFGQGVSSFTPSGNKQAVQAPYY